MNTTKAEGAIVNNDNVTQQITSSSAMHIYIYIYVIPIHPFIIPPLLELTHTTAALLVIPLSQALEALLAAGAVLELTLAALRQHALGDYGGADDFVARLHHAIEADKSQYHDCAHCHRSPNLHREC